MALPTIDTLLLTDQERRVARARIEEMAYFKWQDAGCPENEALRFWCEAELEWIEYHYVPSRREEKGTPRFKRTDYST